MCRGSRARCSPEHVLLAHSQLSEPAAAAPGSVLSWSRSWLSFLVQSGSLPRASTGNVQQEGFCAERGMVESQRRARLVETPGYSSGFFQHRLGPWHALAPFGWLARRAIVLGLGFVPRTLRGAGAASRARQQDVCASCRCRWQGPDPVSRQGWVLLLVSLSVPWC